MSSATNIVVLVGLGIAGILLAVQRRRKTIKEDFGAFVERIQLLPPPQPAPPKAPHPLTGLVFSIKELFDVEGYVTGFGNPDWRRTHEPAVRTAPAVSLLVEGGATCVGRNVMDEMAYSIDGENKHYGTPTNPAASSRIPGGSSSGSAVAVAAELVDFSLGTDTGGSVRVPAAFCGILGFRPSHGAVSTVGVVPMAQSFDTVGWFARDPDILRRVGHTLLQLPFMEYRKPRRVIIADDSFQFTKFPSGWIVNIVVQSTEKLFGRQVLHHMSLGKYIADKVPSLKYFRSEESRNGEGEISALKALWNALRLRQRYEFKKNHEVWINSVKPDFGPGISGRIRAALDIRTDDENIDLSLRVREEAREALNSLLKDDEILVIPTTADPPPKLNMKVNFLEDFQTRAFTLLCIAGMSGCCQASVPLGEHDNCPTAVSFIARHGGDRFLLDTVRATYSTLKQQVEISSSTQTASSTSDKIEAAEIAKEKVCSVLAIKKEDFMKLLADNTVSITSKDFHPGQFKDTYRDIFELVELKEIAKRWKIQEMKIKEPKGKGKLIMEAEEDDFAKQDIVFQDMWDIVDEQGSGWIPRHNAGWDIVDLNQVRPWGAPPHDPSVELDISPAGDGFKDPNNES